LKNEKQKFEKPNRKDLKEILEKEIPEEVSVILLNQIEELCLIIIEHYENE
jgi:hypothetical protein